MTQPTSDATAAPKSMDDIVALCRRRGFVFQSSEIYGGINGFWDYGPLGTELKRNLKNAWWTDMVHRELMGPFGAPVDIVGVDSTIIMNPKVWEASGHVSGFNDPMVDCRETKARYRADHLFVQRFELDGTTAGFATVGAGVDEARKAIDADRARRKVPHGYGGLANAIAKVRFGVTEAALDDLVPFDTLDATARAAVLAPEAKEVGTLTEPRMFNLMFETFVGALRSDDAKAYLRPETAQGIFANFENVVNSTRVRVPFGIAQIGKAFRNEVTPRNFTFRSREFEQMEIEFFVHPSQAPEWYAFWRDTRFAWWQSLGLAGGNLQLREHDADELAHYAKEGAGTSDIEYRFPFTAPGFGELEGVAHRSDYDLRQHAEHSGKRDKMKYFDQERNERYFPHVIEPSGGADRGTLALLCEAYTPDESRASKVYMAFHPRLAPVKAGVFPLVNKDGMPEIGERLYRQLRKRFVCEYDPKQSIGKRYARMDEAGTPYCFTIDGQSVEDQSVTVRHRDTQAQERIGVDHVERFLTERIGGA
ncbi:MAG: glycine--tRNA ligase [Phycisphaerales bacterium]|nr:glycine--tRNA ligase [Phycisphaerales bacterium]